MISAKSRIVCLTTNIRSTDQTKGKGMVLHVQLSTNYEVACLLIATKYFPIQQRPILYLLKCGIVTFLLYRDFHGPTLGRPASHQIFFNHWAILCKKYCEFQYYISNCLKNAQHRRNWIEFVNEWFSPLSFDSTFVLTMIAFILPPQFGVFQPSLMFKEFAMFVIVLHNVLSINFF